MDPGGQIEPERGRDRRETLTPSPPAALSDDSLTFHKQIRFQMYEFALYIAISGR